MQPRRAGAAPFRQSVLPLGEGGSTDAARGKSCACPCQRSARASALRVPAPSLCQRCACASAVRVPVPVRLCARARWALGAGVWGCAFASPPSSCARRSCVARGHTSVCKRMRVRARRS
eukprot:4175531-Pleurochrysis_carterae.AAC.4